MSYYAVFSSEIKDGKMRQDRILLEGLVFFGRHGTLPAERELGQRFVVSVEMSVDLQPAGTTDDLTKTVDYGEVHRKVRDIVEGESVNLIETVAEKIASAILENHSSVDGVRVRVEKPEVRLGDTVLQSAAVEILRRR